MLDLKNMENIFLTISTILGILMVTPPRSATAERVNFALRSVKTQFHSAMIEDRFNSLVLLYIHCVAFS